MPFGVLGAGFANYATKLKFVLRIDDALDIFAVHGMGGFVGNVCTAFFAADYVARLDGVTEINGGWLNQHWIQIGYQLADSFSGGAYSFVGTCIILFIMNLIPGLHLRASEEAEILGIDDAEIGEFGMPKPHCLTSVVAWRLHANQVEIAYDYVELTREVLNDVDADPETQSRFSGDAQSYDPREKNRGIPLMDSRMFSSAQTSHQ